MSGIRKIWQEWRGLIVFALLMVLFRSSVADWYVVPTGSMKPTIVEGDRIFVNKLAYDIKIPFTLISLATWDTPERGDIVVFDSPVDDQRLVKRVVGLPGDTIEIRNNVLFINNKRSNYLDADQQLISRYWESGEQLRLYNETFDGRQHLITVRPRDHFSYRNFGPVRVLDGYYFMLGDNRDNSADSRYIGAVNSKYILGKANRVLFSFQRTDRFFVNLR
jgi:signal peptidase I